MRIEILKPFKPLISQEGKQYTYLCFSSGRGCGKSFGISQALIIRALQEKVRILCLREIQKSINESVKALLESLISDLGLSEYFTIKRDTIECVNGSKFIFSGMRDINAINIKSIANINITWIEEGEAFSKKSWELLIPSVLRVDKAQIVISFNPRYDDDVIYQKFFMNTPPPNSYIVKLTPDDNPFFKKSNLEVQRKHDLETLPKNEYTHKWEGEILAISNDCIFTQDGIKKMQDDKRPLTLDEFNRNDYAEVYLALDPATTSAYNSNEFGAVIVGITKSGIYHIIGDYTGNHTPSDIAILTGNLCLQFALNGVIVEVNQGGDFIKHALLEYNPELNIIEVRAVRDKVYRSAPLASLASLGKLKLLDIFTDTKRLLRQIRNMTKRGYQGARGESPDALDACAWGIYHLAGLSNKFMINSLFNLEILKNCKDFNFKESGVRAFISYDGVNNLSIILFEIVSNKHSTKKISLLDCFNFEKPDINKIMRNLISGSLDIPNIEKIDLETIYTPLIYGFDNFNYPKLSSYEISKEKYDDKLLFISECVKNNMLQFGDKAHSYQIYKNVRGEILKLELTRAKLGEKYESIIINALFELLKLYF